MTRPYQLALAFFAILAVFRVPFAIGQADLELLVYTVDLSDAQNHYVTIEAQVVPTGDQTDLMMAVWTPGSYLVREYSRHIDSISVSDESGNSVEFEKSSKNRWIVNSRGTSRLVVKYRIYCNDLSVRTNFVDGEFAVLNGAPSFLTVPEYRNKNHHVRLKMPSRWNRSATSLESMGPAHEYVASSFDELVDSPIVAGNIAVYPFEVSGVQHQLVNVGESGYWNGTTAAADLKKMVVAHHKMWGTVPYSRYLFLNVICGRGGGLEHDNSSVIMTSRWSFRDKDRYKNWLSLASHEFYHTWNIRRLRPKALVEYDYEKEVYTPSLWIAEGVTSYYEDLLLSRADLISQDEYLERLSGNISSVQSSPGRLKQSLKESSFDSWIKFYRTSANSSDTQISYYSKGAVVAFLLDANIRQQTRGKKSLDDVMRTMYERYANTGYLPSEFRSVVDEIAGSEMNEFFQKYVDSTDELDFVSTNEWFGLRFKNDEELESEKSDNETGSTEKSTAEKDDSSISNVDLPTSDQSGEKSNEGEKQEDDSDKVWLGFNVSGGTVVNVDLDSPATEIGLNLGDELLAINGFRVHGNIDQRLKQFKIGDELTLLVSRRDRILTKTITVAAEKESKHWDLKRLSKPSEKQSNRIDNWLGVEPQKTE